MPVLITVGLLCFIPFLVITYYRSNLDNDLRLNCYFNGDNNGICTYRCEIGNTTSNFTSKYNAKNTSKPLTMYRECYHSRIITNKVIHICNYTLYSVLFIFFLSLTLILIIFPIFCMVINHEKSKTSERFGLINHQTNV